MKTCKYHIWQPNYSDRKSDKKGYKWRCFGCSRVRKTTPEEFINQKVDK